MKRKKLNRLLSLTLTAVMVTSMVSAPVNAETVTDHPAAVQEESVGEGEDAKGEESVPGTEAEVEDTQGKTDETAEGQTPSNEDTEAEPGETKAKDAEDTEAEPEGTKAEETEHVQAAEQEKEAEVSAPSVKKTRAAGTQDTNSEAEGIVDAASPAAETEGEQAKPIIVGDASGQTATLDAAVEAAAAGEVKVIELTKNATLSKNLDNVTIKTKGHRITIPEGANVAFGAGTFIENEEAFVSGQNATSIQVEGTLTVKGGKYYTNGIQMLMVTGQATVEGGEFKCTATGSEENQYYDGRTLLGVNGTGAKLTITGGTADAKLGKDNLGMYGIYIWGGGEVVLGTEDGKGPTVESMFAAVAMNNTTAPGRITIKGGTYKSSVACTEDGEKKFNSVIYLPGNAVVNISGGTFEATGAGTDRHVISIPYNKPSADANPVRLSLNITGGTFKAPAGNTVFYHPTKAEEDSKISVAVSGGQFSSNIKEELLSTSIADGLDAYQPDGNGMFQIAAPAVATVDGKKFSTLEAAVAVAATAADKTIILTKNSDFEGGYDLTGLTLDTAGYLITIPEGKTLALTGGTVKNTILADNTKWGDQATNPHTIFNVKGSLNINGGTYQTKGVQMMEITGTAEIGGNAKLECNAKSDELTSKKHYDGSPLINVTGSGNLKVMDAAINANVGNTAKTDGMYGIYVNHGGTLTLGEAGKNPTINSMFAPVGMNGLTSPGNITINGGTYTSNAECVDDTIKKFNAVLYLPASADVTINGGTFTAAGTKGEQHVISVPYSVVEGKGVSLNLVINGGTFTTVNKDDGSKIFFNDGIEGKDNNHKISVRGGSFSSKPEYDAGCNAAKKEGDMWVISGTPRHSIAWVSKKDSTCWEEGAAGHYECEYCHKMYASNAADAEELTEADVVILKKEHVGVKHDAVTEGSCTQATTKEYYECPNCGNCYESSAALVADKTGVAGKKPEDFVQIAAGHKYKKNDGSLNAVIDTKGFNPADYRQEEANGVTVTLACLAEGCGNKITADEVFVTITEGSLRGDCGQPENLKLRVKAIFKKNDLGEATAKEEEFKRVEKDVDYTAPVRQHVLDESVVTVNWDKFNISAFTPNSDNRVKATGVCKNCGKTVEATTVAVTSSNYPATGVPTCKTTCDFKADLTFGTDIGSGDNVQKAPVVTVTKTIKGEHTFQPKDKYEPATCMKAGHWGTFECTTCHNEYLGADSEEPVTEQEKLIAKRPHTINDPDFVWAEDAEGEEIVQGLFTCTACENTVPLTAVKTRNEQESAKVTCGQKGEQVYDLEVGFDKSALVESADGTELTYNSALAKPATTVKYTGKLKREEEQPHQFKNIPAKNLTVAWADQAGADAYHDVTKGVTVTAVCGRDACQKKLVVTSPGKIDEANSDIMQDTGFEYIEPNVELEENEATVPATCQKDGNAVYDVIVTYKDVSGSVIELGKTTISTKVKSTPDAHAWGNVAWTWTPSKEMVEVDAKDSVTGETVKCKVPKYKATAIFGCTEDHCTAANKVEKVMNAASTSTVEGTSMEIEVTLEKGSCVSNSKTICVAKVYEGKKLIAESEAKEDNLEATGHKTTVKWDWESNAEDNNGTATRYKKVTATRYCTVCSDVENAKDKYEKEIAVVEIPESGDITPASDPSKSMTLYVTTGGNSATCDKAGTTIYSAVLKQGTSEDGKQIAESKQQMSSTELGHDIRWFIDWKEDTTKTGADRWKATMTKKCQRAACTEPAVETKTCEVTFASKPATCSEDGLNSWTLKSTELPAGEKYADEQCKDGVLKAELTKKEQKLLKDENAHNYGAAEVVWGETAAASGANEITVTCTRTCSYAADNEAHIPAETKTFTAAKQPSEAVTDCSQGYEWTYKVSDADKKNVEGWNMPENWKEGVYTHTVPEAEGRKNHILTFVRGESSNDCTKPAYPDYYECSRCHKTYSDLNCQNVYDGPTKDTATAQGHLYGTPKFHWVEGKVGKVAEARLECIRSGCATTAKDHFKTIAAEIHEDETLEGVAAQCADTQRAPLTVDGYQLGKGEGYQWVSVTAKISETETKESMLHMVLPAVEHHFVNGVCEWCKKEGGITIEFYGRENTNVIGRTYLSSKNLPTDKEDVELATAVNQLGYIFRGWTMEKDGTEVSKDIKQEILEAAAKITTETGTIKVYPVYERDDAGLGSVEVQYVLRTGTTESAVKEAVKAEQAIASRYEAAAESEETVSGKTVYFSHWERNGEIVGTALSYELYIQTASKVSLKAVYVANQSDSKAGTPTAAITDIYTSTVDSVDKLSFSATIVVPEEGYEVREVGFLYSLSSKVVMTDKNMLVDNMGATVDGVVLPHKKYTFTGDSSTKIMTIQIPEAMKDRTVYARPYVTVRNTVSGEVETIYGTVKASSYNQAK